MIDSENSALVLKLDSIEELIKDVGKDYKDEGVEFDYINIAEIILSVNNLRKDLKKHDRRNRRKAAKG